MKEKDDYSKISKMQLKVLKILASIYGDDYSCCYFKQIAKKTKLSIREVRIACRALLRKGYAKHVKGLIGDDGMLVGSGYSCTLLGKQFYEKIKML